MRVAELDMTNSNHQCPSGLRERTDSNIRTCVSTNTSASCSSDSFETFNIDYSRVCGKIIGYQIGGTNSFKSDQVGINSYYVDGISLTHGSPREHVWTFAAARDMSAKNRCPGAGPPPPYVGSDYFCDTGATTEDSVTDSMFFRNNPLWDCEEQSLNCDVSTPPWFYKELPQPTTNNIEMRICRDENEQFEDVAIEMFEIYVQ